MKEKIIEKLKKIQSLGERGYKGEAEAAKKMLDKQLKKHGLTIEDLAQKKIKRYEVRFKTTLERKALIQIIASLGLDSYEWTKSKRKTLGVNCTPLMYAEIINMKEFYFELLNNELSVFMSAFLHKHSLFRPETSEERQKRIGKEPNPDFDEIARVLEMMNGLSNKRYEKESILKLE